MKHWLLWPLIALLPLAYKALLDVGENVVAFIAAMMFGVLLERMLVHYDSKKEGGK